MMCVLCGALQSSFHWSIVKDKNNTYEVAQRTNELTRSRYLKIGILNKLLGHFALELRAWSGETFLLSDKKGNTLITQDLSKIWENAKKLGVILDPLDDKVIKVFND